MLSYNFPQVPTDYYQLFEPTPQWYSVLSAFPSSSKPSGPPSPQTLSTLQARGTSLHQTELTAYESATSANKLTASSSDAAFLQRILTSGTLSDRLSALTLMAQSSPLHNTRALETLRGMSQKKGREESLKALRAIVDWWIGGGAPDRKLKSVLDYLFIFNDHNAHMQGIQVFRRPTVNSSRRDGQAYPRLVL